LHSLSQHIEEVRQVGSSGTREATVATTSARTARPSPSSSTPSWYTCPAGAGSWCSTSPRPGSRSWPRSSRPTSWRNYATTPSRCWWPPPPRILRHPGARIIELDEDGLQIRAWKDLMTVALYRRFLADPGYFGMEW